MKLTPITPEQLDRLTERQVEQLQSAPRTVGDVLVAMLIAGLAGAAIGLGFGVLLSVLGAPAAVLVTWSGRAGLLAACFYLALWSIPLGKARSLLWYREARRIVSRHEFHKLEAYREIVTLKARVVQLERALADTEHQRDEARRDVYRIEQEARAAESPNFVTSEAITPQMVADARKMIQFWFTSSATKEERRCLSRTEAEGEGYRWSQTRHRKAQSLLVNAGVLYINVKQPEITIEPLDAALRKLTDYVEAKRSAEAAARAMAAKAAQSRYVSDYVE